MKRFGNFLRKPFEIMLVILGSALLSAFVGTLSALSVIGLLFTAYCFVQAIELLVRIADAQQRQAHALEVLAKITTHSIDGRM